MAPCISEVTRFPGSFCEGDVWGYVYVGWGNDILD
jgi:hypothetical protein